MIAPLFRRLRLITITIAACLGLAAGWAVLELTEPPGPGLDPDAMQYLSAGASLAHTGELRVPLAPWDSPDTTAALAHFPPGFPATISLGVAAGLTPQNSARLVEAIGAAITTIALLLAAAEGGSLLGGLLGVLFLAVSPAMVIVHGSVLSEPLFLALFTCFVWQLARPRGAPGRTAALGLLGAAAALVRYAGASLIGAALLDAWIGDMWMGGADTRERPSLIERTRRSLLAMVLPVAALGAWALSRPKTSGAQIRHVAFYIDGLGATLTEGAQTVGHWFAPGEDLAAAGWVLAVAVMMALMALVLRDLRTVFAGVWSTSTSTSASTSATASAGGPAATTASASAPASTVSAQRLLRALAITKVTYLGLIGASRLFADGDIPLDERILAPIFVIGSLGVGVMLVRWWFAASRGLLLLTLGITASWVVASVKETANWVNIYREDGGDFASREWVLSPIVEYAGALPGGSIIYSNWPSAIWFHKQRAVHKLPEVLTPKIAADFRAKLAREHGSLLAFHVRTTDAASPDSLAMMAGLVPVQWWSDGVLWRAPEDAMPRSAVPRPAAPSGAAPTKRPK
ncbi:MAG: hypothetical protein NTZ43_12915 [Gemmatimonadetes bacterium]|nr:hypothetical protein [Gemmatimonadota bacterium]